MIISSAEPLVPIFVFVSSVESNCHFRKNFTCSTGFKSYTVKVVASKILFIVRDFR